MSDEFRAMPHRFTLHRLESSPEDFNNVKAAPLARQIDHQIFSDFEQNQRLWGWNYIDNSDTLRIARPEIADYPEVAIIIQGGIDNYKPVEFALKRYSLLYPNTHIIISTWSDSNHDALTSISYLAENSANIHILLSHKPSFRGYGEMNTNLQILSTIRGINLAQRLGAEYALKVRSDVVLGSCEFLQTLLTHHHTFRNGIPPSQRGKIIVLSMNSYLCRPFSVSDHISFGYVDDMKLMWNLDLPTSNSSVRKISLLPSTGNEAEPITGNDIYHLAWSAKPQMMDESYLVSGLMDAANYSYTFDWRDSKHFIASCFIVLDTSSLDVFWPKYGGSLSYCKFRHTAISNFSSSQFGMSEITFTRWLSWYNKYIQ